MQITFITAINSSTYLPNFIVFILDDDLIKFLGFSNNGKATFYGEWIEWYIKQITEAIKTKKGYLPQKAKEEGYPVIYWVQLPVSKHLNADNYDNRVKFNLTLESVVKQQEDMRMVKLKQIWDTDNTELISYGNTFTEAGLSTYWDAIDAAVKFNIDKRKEFLLKEGAKQWQQRKNDKTPRSSKKDPRDPMYELFKKCREDDVSDREKDRDRDRYHWSREPGSNDRRRQKFQETRKFILPRAPSTPVHYR